MLDTKKVNNILCSAHFFLDIRLSICEIFDIINNIKELVMPHSICPDAGKCNPSFDVLFKPAQKAMKGMPPLTSGCNRPLEMGFEDELKALVFYHLEEHISAQHLLQVLQENDYARERIAPKAGIKKSSFSEAVNNRGQSNLLMSFADFKLWLPACYRNNIPSWEISLLSMARLSMPSFPCIGPITEKALKKPKSIWALM
jgi:hypothetical protein